MKPEWKRTLGRASMLSPAQQSMLDLIAAGESNQQIADRLGLPLAETKDALNDILWTLDLPSREEAAGFWQSYRSRVSRAQQLKAFVPAPLRHAWLGWTVVALFVVGIALPFLRGGDDDAPATAALPEASTALAVPSSPAALAPVATLAPTGGVEHAALAFPPKGPLGRLAFLDTTGDLVVQPLPTGAAAVVRHGPNVRRPSWSRSGDYLAVVENGYLVVLADSRVDTVTVAPGPDVSWQWSPTEDLLAVFTSAGMVLYDPATGDRRTIRGQGAPLSEQPGPVLWSPDGSRILYTYFGRHTAAPTDTIHEMRIFDTRTGQDFLLIERTTPPASQVVPFAWSGDGQWVYFRDAGVFANSAWVDGVPVFAMPANGGTAARLGVSLGLPGMFASAPGSPVSAYIEGSGRFATDGGRSVLLVTGGEQSPLISVAPGTHAYVAWSPGGTRLAGVAMPEPGIESAALSASSALMRRKLWIHEPGQPPAQLTDDPAYRDEYPVWSSDGDWVFFTRVDAAGQASAWRVAATGGIPEQVAAGIGHGPGEVYGWVRWDQLLDWWHP